VSSCFIKRAEDDFKTASGCSDLNGRISKKQFVEFFRNTPAQLVMDSLFRSFDRNNDGSITWREWVRDDIFFQKISQSDPRQVF
jgi:hypothetical protein